MNYKNQLIKLPQNRVWRSYTGGRTLDTLVGKNDPQDGRHPEDWIGSVTRASNPNSQSENEGISVVEVDGNEVLLPDLIATDPEYFLGASHISRYGNEPMVLVKLLDSAARLQLQVHPTAEFASEFLQSSSGKAEAYYILSVREEVEDPFIYLGFKRSPDRNLFKHLIETQDIDAMERYMNKVPVKPGDILFVPGGVPHAIGGGLFLVEILEPTDLVVRFEFEKDGITLPESVRFMNRGLDFCIDIIDFNAEPESKDQLIAPKLEKTYNDTAHRYDLIGSETTPCFQVKKIVAKGFVESEESTFFTGVVTAGRCILKTSEATIELDTFEKFFCPAGLGSYQIIADEEVHILQCFPPA